MQNNKTIEHLKKVLANSYALSIKLQNYHWNVEGKNFKSLHELFGSQYNELNEAIDDLAERIRALGSKVDANFNYFAQLSEIKDGNYNFDNTEMVQDLMNDHEEMSKIFAVGVEIAQAQEDEGTADMYIEREKVHDKAAWMLRSSL